MRKDKIVMPSASARLQSALHALSQALEKRPDKNADTIEADLMAGRVPRYPPITMGLQIEPPAGDAPRGEPPPLQRLAEALEGAAAGLAMENPIRPCLPVGLGGVGFLATAFGAKLDSDNPAAATVVKEPLSPSELERCAEPDPLTGGLTPQVLQYIDLIKAATPEWLKLWLPDMQGPFNIAHQLMGSEIFLEIGDQPKRLHRFMQRITDHFIAVHRLLCERIGPARLHPSDNNRYRIAECSCNLVSTDVYEEFVLPYDLQICRHYGNRVAIHPCAGRHVIDETLRHLPVVRMEAGKVPCAVAGSFNMDEILPRLGGRKTVLLYMEDLLPGVEEQTARRYIEALQRHQTIEFYFGALHWRQPQKQSVVDLHRRLDDFYMACLGRSGNL